MEAGPSNGFSCTVDKKTETKIQVKDGVVFEKLKGPPKYECPICHKQYSARGNLKTHMIIHDEKRAFKCGVCGKKFVRKQELFAHYRTHNGDKPFVCKICGRGFTQAGNLRTHEFTHSDEKLFVCPVCPDGSKAFRTKSGLKMHMVFHGEKKHQCYSCDKKFFTANDLKNHEKKHLNIV